jgi:hypothetical protein
MPGVVSIRIPRLEVDQELQRGLIGIGVQTLKHLCPMRLERVGSPAGARFCVPVSAVDPPAPASKKSPQLSGVGHLSKTDGGNRQRARSLNAE